MKTSHLRQWLIWSVVVTFYFYQYFLRVSPTVLIQELTDFFHIDASDIGNFSAYYFYIYAILQIPVGMLIDKFGAKILLSLATLACGLGTLLFGCTSHLFIADIGRLLQGAGSAFAFVGMIYVCAHYFNPAYLGFLICFGDSLGKLGAVFGSGPYTTIIKMFSWRHTLVVSGLIGILLSVVIFFLIKEGKEDHFHRTPQGKSFSLIHQLKILVTEKQMWMTVIVSSLLVLTTTSFAGLWGVPFLEVSYSMSKEVASYAISIFFLGSIIGAPLFGYYSDSIRKRAPFLIISGGLGFALIFFLIYKPFFSPLFVYIILFFLGLLSSIQNLTYCVAIEKNPPSFKGAAIGFVNFFVFLTGAIAQPLVGFLLEKHSTFIYKTSAIYTIRDYQYALICFPLSFLIACFFSFFIKDNKKV